MCKDRPKRGVYHLKEFDLTSTRESHRVVTRFMGPGIKGLKRAGIRDHSHGIWNHNAWDRDQRCFLFSNAG